MQRRHWFGRVPMEDPAGPPDVPGSCYSTDQYSGVSSSRTTCQTPYSGSSLEFVTEPDVTLTSMTTASAFHSELAPQIRIVCRHPHCSRNGVTLLVFVEFRSSGRDDEVMSCPAGSPPTGSMWSVCHSCPTGHRGQLVFAAKGFRQRWRGVILSRLASGR